MKQHTILTKFKINQSIKDLISDSVGLEESTKDEILKREWISVEDLKYLLNMENLPKQKTLHILSDLEFIFLKDPVKPKTKEYTEQMIKLRNLELERQYQEMVKKESIYDKTLLIHKENRLGAKQDIDDEMLTPSRFAKQVKEQLTTVVNIIFTSSSVAYAVWYWTRSSMRDSNISFRLFLSLIFGLVALVAEVVVYNGYHRRINEAKAKERKQKEKKKIVETTIIQKGKISTVDLSGE